MRAFVLAGALALAACSQTPDAPIPDQWDNIALETEAIELGAERVGVLRFRGGLALRGERDDGFGGWSGLEVMQDGRLVAVSDAGKWLSARLVLDGEGALVGLTDARMALMRDERGRPFANKDDGDAEDITQLADGRVAVSFEQTHSIRIYDINRDGPFGAARAGPALAGVARLPSNSSLEAMASDGMGALIVGAEDAGLIWRAPVGGGVAVEPVGRYALQFGFALTAFDRLPDGDYVALERFYAPAVGAQTRITRMAAASIGGGATADVTELALMRPPLTLDNFEGIAVARRPDGGVRLYILSDDNFSARQRTLLYAFDVDEGGS